LRTISLILQRGGVIAGGAEGKKGKSRHKLGVYIILTKKGRRKKGQPRNSARSERKGGEGGALNLSTSPRYREGRGRGLPRLTPPMRVRPWTKNTRLQRKSATLCGGKKRKKPGLRCPARRSKKGGGGEKKGLGGCGVHHTRICFVITTHGGGKKGGRETVKKIATALTRTAPRGKRRKRGGAIAGVCLPCIGSIRKKGRREKRGGRRGNKSVFCAAYADSIVRK